ncbi:MAG: hypothetical protein JXA67_08255, partial [Micromonosporaceae bacterium]|nr:hypothetical protein [Micromonosporaceae bacterium]
MGYARRNFLGRLLVTFVAGAAICVPGVARAATVRTATLPAGVTAGIAVYDRQTGTFTEQQNATMQFRAASVVKLLIALDYLWELGPSYAVSTADRARLDAMLRSSDDAVASDLWTEGGNGAIVNRMITRLGLQNTAPPPSTLPGYWGYTAMTPADTVRVYRYILDSAPAVVRDLIMGNLRQSTRCAVDGFDQWFGIPSAFNRPWAVKQGWSGFGAQGTCTANAAAQASGTQPAAAQASGTQPAAAQASGT